MTKNTQIPFTSDKTIKNFSRYKLTEEEVEILKYDLRNSHRTKTFIGN